MTALMRWSVKHRDFQYFLRATQLLGQGFLFGAPLRMNLRRLLVARLKNFAMPPIFAC